MIYETLTIFLCIYSLVATIYILRLTEKIKYNIESTIKQLNHTTQATKQSLSNNFKIALTVKDLQKEIEDYRYDLHQGARTQSESTYSGYTVDNSTPYSADNQQ